jgi:hypothetical protein
VRNAVAGQRFNKQTGVKDASTDPDTDGEQRTVAIVLSTGDEAMACLKAFAGREHVTAAQFTANEAFAGVM